MLNVDLFVKAVEAGKLEGKVKGENAKIVGITSERPALEKFVARTPLHEWVVLEEPFVIQRLSTKQE